MDKPTDKFSLSNGHGVPCLGYGTWQIPDGEAAVSSVLAALRVGYRHIDTAAFYQNERSIGKAIRESGIDRQEIFVTSKVWNSDRGYNGTKRAFARSLENLGLDWLDLYLIHWPASKSRFADWEKINCSTWEAISELYKNGSIKAIGVSNFLVHHLEVLMKADVPPMVNQIEFHPGQMQRETVDFCQKNGILVEAWGPLGTGKMLSSPKLAEIAAKYNKSVAQLCIRWCLQNGVLPIPKSSTDSRIEENANVFDFSISEGDMESISAMPYFGGSGLHPDKVGF
ncbi:MAG: aldo/keto reductase [Holophagales bacterium]|jgi:diketogulonate reductase-like aldo/keto reductase|nr:aldo/keto reductase [Holophagales bacterium]